MNPTSSRATDVVVIGGGPGGSVCASKLRKHGLSVIVLEKSPGASLVQQMNRSGTDIK